MIRRFTADARNVYKIVSSRISPLMVTFCFAVLLCLATIYITPLFPKAIGATPVLWGIIFFLLFFALYVTGRKMYWENATEQETGYWDGLFALLISGSIGGNAFFIMMFPRGGIAEAEAVLGMNIGMYIFGNIFVYMTLLGLATFMTKRHKTRPDEKKFNKRRLVFIIVGALLGLSLVLEWNAWNQTLPRMLTSILAKALAGAFVMWVTSTNDTRQSRS